MTIEDHAIELVEHHPAVRRVRLVGSRATGTATDVSDWDFAVETDDFQAVARDIPLLLRPLAPVAQQWDRLSETWCWMVVLRGPIKLDFLFSELHRSEPPWQPTAGNLGAIDAHFWDWALWLCAKRARGHADLVQRELQRLFVHILRPMGVERAPTSLDEAVLSYREARDRLERAYGVSVPRELEREVERALDIGHDALMSAAGSSDGTTFMGVHFAVADMTKALDFYRRVGLRVPDGAEDEPFVEIDLGGGVHLAFSAPIVAMYDPAWRGPSPSTATVLQLRLASRAAVDEMYASLTGSGYQGHLAPIDAFWGNRYCEVDDAEGHTVGFQSPTDDSMRS